MSNSHFPLDTSDALDLEEHEAPDGRGSRGSRNGRRPSRDDLFDDDRRFGDTGRAHRDAARRDDGKEQRRRAVRTREEPALERRGPVSRGNGGVQRERGIDRITAQFAPRSEPYARPPQSTSPEGGYIRRSGNGVPYRPDSPDPTDRRPYTASPSQAAQGAGGPRAAQDGSPTARSYYPFKSSRPSSQGAAPPRHPSRSEGTRLGGPAGTASGSTPHQSAPHRERSRRIDTGTREGPDRE